MVAVVASAEGALTTAMDTSTTVTMRVLLAFKMPIPMAMPSVVTLTI